MIIMIGVGGMLVFDMLSLGHFTEQFREFVFVLAHDFSKAVGVAGQTPASGYPDCPTH